MNKGIKKCLGYTIQIVCPYVKLFLLLTTSTFKAWMSLVKCPYNKISVKSN